MFFLPPDYQLRLSHMPQYFQHTIETLECALTAPPQYPLVTHTFHISPFHLSISPQQQNGPQHRSGQIVKVIYSLSLHPLAA